MHPAHPTHIILNSSTMSIAASFVFIAILCAAGAAAQPGPPFGPPLTAPEIPFILASIGALDSVFKEYETPLASRFTNYYSAMWWNCIATHSAGYRDTLTKERPSIVAPDNKHTTQDRAACVVQATVSLTDLYFGGNDALLEAIGQFELSVDAAVPSNVKDCEGDAQCLGGIAAQAGYDPTTMGHVLAAQTYSYGLSDGFNQLGKDGGCEVSCRAYSDTTGYQPTSFDESNPRPESHLEEVVVDEATGFCNWGVLGTAASSTCDGGSMGGTWCNANQGQCEEGCGGRWCTWDRECPDSFEPGVHVGSREIVERGGVVYQCASWPYNGYCSKSAWYPAEGTYWRHVWTVLGSCEGDEGHRRRWEPLLEDNGKGFFYRQEFVTPHIGQTAKFRYLPELDREHRVAREPTYGRSLEDEMDAVIAEMATLDDFKKVEIEAFDNKLWVGNAIISAFVNKLLTSAAQGGFVDAALGQPGLVLSFERLVHFVQGYTATEYDSIVVVWKEKVAYDLIRPTSIAKERDDEVLHTWAPGGIQDFPARDFEAYIRVMPHAEYPSGSACLFKGEEDYVKEYLTELGLSTEFPVAFPEVNPGESKVEPGAVPSEPITLQYAMIEEMAAAGSYSRFTGGMHFFDSIPAGTELCDGIGTAVAIGSVDLLQTIF